MVVVISVTPRRNHQNGVNPFAVALSKGDVRGGLAEFRAKKRIFFQRTMLLAWTF